MPWNEVTVMSQRKEFVLLSQVEGSNLSELCLRFGISRPTAYKWLRRYCGDDSAWSQDRSRRPLFSPRRTDSEMERLVLAVRSEHSYWGGRKIRRRLEDLGYRGVPSASTITEILRRHGLLVASESAARGPMQRFEHPSPNDLWQMDFKGRVSTARGFCHPLTVIDDHSRFAVCVSACGNEEARTVQRSLVPVFRCYGLPVRMLSDNGVSFSGPNSRYNYLSAWLIRLGISISHGRPYHPQTQGKNERFNRTLGLEAISGRNFIDLSDCQFWFDRFRYSYNCERPHEALGMAVPQSRYHVSRFSYPEVLPPVEYPPGDLVRRVNAGGALHFRSDFYPIGRAFSKEWVGLRSTDVDGVLDVYYCHQRVMVIDVRDRSWRQT